MGLALSLAVGAWLATAPLAALEVGRSLENCSLNLDHRLRPALGLPAETLVAGIDQASFQALGSSSPYPGPGGGDPQL